MSKELLTHLPAYAEGKLDPETTIAVDGLITRYLDDKLDRETSDTMRALIEADEALAKIVADNAEGKKWFEEEALPAFKAAEIKPSADLKKFVDDLIADPDAWGEEPKDDQESKVVPLRPERRTSQPSWMLMAASIGGVLVIAGGTVLYMLDQQNQLTDRIATLDQDRSAQQAQIAELAGRSDALRSELDTAASSLQQAQTNLAAATEAADQLTFERNDLEQQLAALEAEATAAAEQADQRQQTLASDIEALHSDLVTATDAQRAAEESLTTANATIADLEARRGDLERQLAVAERDAGQAADQAEEAQLALAERIDSLETELTEAWDAQATAESQLANASDSIASLQQNRQALVEQLASRDTELRQLADAQAEREVERDAEIERLTAELDDVRINQEAAIAELDSARERIAALETSRAELNLQLAARDAEVAAGEQKFADLSKRAGWLNQVAGYHRGYAGDMNEVEFTDDQIGQLLTWLTRRLGRPVTAPDLTQYDMEFIGGRLFFVNGMPVAQLAYHDEQGRLLGFCFMRNPSGDEKTPDQTRNGDDLYLIDWKDEAYQYVLIGFEDFRTLEPIADQLARTYRYET